MHILEVESAFFYTRSPRNIAGQPIAAIMLAAYHALYGAARALFESERSFWVVAISLAHGVTLLSTSACFLALDRFPSMDKYRLQDKRCLLYTSPSPRD